MVLSYIKFRPENLYERDHSKDLGVDFRTILGWILGIEGGKVWTGFIWLRIGTSEHGNEPSRSMEVGEFLD
jgi:hypothetical protein